MSHNRSNLSNNRMNGEEEAALRAEHYALIRSLQKTGSDPVTQAMIGKSKNSTARTSMQRGTRRGPHITTLNPSHMANSGYCDTGLVPDSGADQLPEHQRLTGKKESLLLSSMSPSCVTASNAIMSTTSTTTAGGKCLCLFLHWFLELREDFYDYLFFPLVVSSQSWTQSQS